MHRADPHRVAQETAADDLWVGYWEAIEQIRDTSAVTVTGLCVKAHALWLILEMTECAERPETIADIDERGDQWSRLAWSLARDLLATGRGVTHGLLTWQEGFGTDASAVRVDSAIVGGSQMLTYDGRGFGSLFPTSVGNALDPRPSKELPQDARVLALVTEFLAIGVKLREYNRATPPETVFDMAMCRSNAMLDELVKTRAKTVKGCRAKARAVGVATLLDRDAELSASIVRDLASSDLASDEQMEAGLLAMAADYAVAKGEIRRLEASGVVCDERCAPLDARRQTAREGAAALIAKTSAGVRAKAEIYLSEIEFTRGCLMESLDDLAVSLAPDLVNETPDDPSPDAELICLCDRLVEIEAERHDVFDTIDDEAEQDNANAPRDSEWHVIAARICQIGRPSTRLGAEAMARAANVNVNCNRDGVPMAGDLGEFQGLAACAWLADICAPVPRFLTRA